MRILSDLKMSTCKNTNNTKTIQGDESVFVTMDMFKDMLEQQKNFYEEASFGAFTQLILESSNKRADSLLTEIQELKISF